MRTARRLTAVACAALVAGPATAQSSAGIVIHMTEADFSAGGCPLIDDESLGCETITIAGDGASPQFAWLIAYGWSTLEGWGGSSVGLNAVAFGVSYPPPTDVVAWFACTPFAIPLDDQLIGTWPESDTGVAVAFGGGYAPASGFATLGFLLVEAGSSGRLSIVPHAAAQLDAVQFVSADDETFEIPATGFSSADVGGDAPANAYLSCEGVIPVVETSWGRIKSLY